MTFQELIQSEKTKLEAQEAELAKILDKKVTDAETEYKQAVKDIKFKMKRLESALSLLTEQDDLFKNYVITKKG